MTEIAANYFSVFHMMVSKEVQKCRLAFLLTPGSIDFFRRGQLMSHVRTICNRMSDIGECIELWLSDLKEKEERSSAQL